MENGFHQIGGEKRDEKRKLKCFGVYYLLICYYSSFPSLNSYSKLRVICLMLFYRMVIILCERERERKRRI
jgi:hypothetical protein